jgi:uncharacterized membrane-anchored protein YhcB (DUF1043 family)
MIAPLTAWEQAVIVVLFCVFVGFLLTWFSKQQKDWQSFMDRLTRSWAEEVENRNKQWRDFFTTLNQGNKEDIIALADSMRSMGELTKTIAIRLEEHNEQAKEIKADVITIKDQTRPARRQGPVK